MQEYVAQVAGRMPSDEWLEQIANVQDTKGKNRRSQKQSRSGKGRVGIDSESCVQENRGSALDDLNGNTSPDSENTGQQGSIAGSEGE